MLSGVVLAGGENRRMGGIHKALLSIGGEAMIQRQIRTLSAICSEIVVVTNDAERFAPVVGTSVRIVPDVYRGKGPLAGMHAAMTAVRNEYVWVVGCDMPFLCAEAADRMLTRLQYNILDAVIPRLNDKLHPLHGVYSTSCAKEAANLLEAGTYRVMELFGRIRWEPFFDSEFTALGIDLKFAVNTNTPEEWNEAVSMEGGEPRS